MGELPAGAGIAHIAQSVEHFLGKEEVTGSIPVVGLRKKQVSSSIGRAAVSKTAGWGFEALLACQNYAR
jgi:hypothetical protein